MTTMARGNGPRFAAKPIAEGGTPLAEWRGWGRTFPTLDLDGCPALVVVAPHPDDETLGFGATASALRRRGVDVTVVAVSDGGGEVPGLSRLERTWLERDRRAELHRAVDLLGLAEPVHLGLPDGDLSAHEDDMTSILSDVLAGQTRGCWCAVTWRGDGHPDHESTGRSAAAAVDRTGAVLLEFPLWMWHWASPDDPDVPWDRMQMGPHDPEAAARKRRAVAAFDTQFKPYEPGLDPVLPPFVLQRWFAVGEGVFL